MNLNKVFGLVSVLQKVQNRQLSTCLVRPLIQKWREERGLPLNPNAYGTLTDKPDYTYLDGRPTPYGTHQKKRILKQREIAHKIIELSKEIDFAVEAHSARQLEAARKRQAILDNKLKPKGNLLLRK